jgi:signal transduction histidine kinase
MRTRIAADLHDDIASSLASVSLYSEVIQRQLQTASAEARSLLNRIRDLSQEVMENISTIVWTVDPRRDELSELLQYFQRYARQLCTTAGISFISQLPEKLKSIVLSPEQRRTIYLILKEGLTNVMRHAHCSQVEFSCTFKNHLLDISLQDNGQGFDLNAVNDGHGLTNMTTRAHTIGASVVITSQPIRGTEIRLRLRMT